MDILSFAQTLFYFTVSVAIISFGILLTILTYHLVCIAKNLRIISENLNDTSLEIKEKIQEILKKLSSLLFLSFFKKRRGRAGKTKGRKDS